MSGESPPTTPRRPPPAASPRPRACAAVQATGPDDRHRHPHRRRVGDRGHDPRVVGQGRRQVKDGDTVVEISTDKVDMELPAPAAGTITEILAAEGETVTVGQVIGRMRAGVPPAPSPPRPRGPRRGASGHQRRGSRRRPPLKRRAPTPRRSPGASPPPRGSISASIQGSARGGRITKADVLAAGNGAGVTAQPAPGAAGRPIPLAFGRDRPADQGQWRRAGALHGSPRSATPAWLGEEDSSPHSAGSTPAGLPLRPSPNSGTIHEHRDQASNLESSRSERDVLPIPPSLCTCAVAGSGGPAPPLPVQ